MGCIKKEVFVNLNQYKMKKNEMSLLSATALTSKQMKQIMGGAALESSNYYCNDENAACTALYGSMEDCWENCPPKKCNVEIILSPVCVG